MRLQSQTEGINNTEHGQEYYKDMNAWKLLHGRYRVFPDGRILSMYFGDQLRRKPLPLNGATNKEGLNHIHIQTPHGKKTISRAQVIASLFVPNSRENTHVYLGFRDGDKSNCHANNLIWVRTPYYTNELKQTASEARKRNIYMAYRGDILIDANFSINELCGEVGMSTIYAYKSLKSGEPSVNGILIRKYTKDDEAYGPMCQLLLRYKNQ